MESLGFQTYFSEHFVFLVNIFFTYIGTYSQKYLFCNTLCIFKSTGCPLVRHGCRNIQLASKQLGSYREFSQPNEINNRYKSCWDSLTAFVEQLSSTKTRPKPRNKVVSAQGEVLSLNSRCQFKVPEILKVATFIMTPTLKSQEKTGSPFCTTRL